jgi:hypothetical protein
MTSLKYASATSSFTWNNADLSFTPASVGWTSLPPVGPDACFGFLNGAMTAARCDNPNGYHVLCKNA